MIQFQNALTLESFSDRLEAFWELSGEKIRLIERNFDLSKGAPVYTVKGQYSTRGWTEWTQGFQFGSAFLQFDATGEEYFLKYATENTVKYMASHVTHIGVHDHGFNNVSTYGALLRLMNESKVVEDYWQRKYLEMALKASSTAQASRWTDCADPNLGYIYSFNGPHSLFSDTARTVRSLILGHQLGHHFSTENDRKVSLLDRAVKHLLTTARYNVYYGEDRDGYDERGRVVHESIFNTVDGNYRCASTQQGYSPFSTWTRGQAWVITGFAEQIEYISTLKGDQLQNWGGRDEVIDILLNACKASADHFIENTPENGIPLWDTGGPSNMEPVDSSASAIAAQGMLRLSRYIGSEGKKYEQAALKMLDTMLSDDFLGIDKDHEGLLLHSVYHWPNRWDYVPEEGGVAKGEATMWGDYHLRELVLYVQRLSENGNYLKFFLS